MQIQSSGTEHRSDMVSRHEKGQSSKPNHILLRTDIPVTHFLTSSNNNASLPDH